MDDPLGKACAELAEYAKLEDDLDVQLAALKTKVDPLKEKVLTLMQQSGVTSVKANGRNVHLRRDIFAGPGEGGREAVVAALRDAGLGELVFESYNAQTLSKAVREMNRDENDMPVLPPELEGAIKVSEKFDVRVTKA